MPRGGYTFLMLWVPLLLTVLAGGCLLVVTGRSGPSRRDWILAGLALPALFLLFFRLADAVVSMLSDFWCFIRIMPAVALYNGYPLYYPDGQGPVLGWIYGPVMPCVQMPLGALPTPTAVVIAGGILNEIVLFVPLFLLICRALRPSPSKAAVAVLILCSVHSLMLHCAPSLFWMRGIQSDTFAIGVAALGFWVLLGAEASHPVSLRRITLASALFAAAVFSKQNELFVLAVPVAAMAIRDGRRAALTMTLMLALAGALGFCLLWIFVGWEAMFLNLWLVPSRHPRLEPGFSIIGLYTLEFLAQCSGFLSMFVVLALLWRRLAPVPAGRREWILERPWILPAAAAVLMFPISVAGIIKVGGADNSNHTFYYLAAAVSMMAAGLPNLEPGWIRSGVPGTALALMVAAQVVTPVDLRSFEERRRDSLLEREYQFALKHPGEVWYSANPLATLYSDHRLYHQGYGVYDRMLANLPPTPRHLRDQLPPRMRWVNGPGYVFWMPSDLTAIRNPEGTAQLNWYEVRHADR